MAERLTEMKIEFDSVVFEEGNAFVSYCPKLDVSSCGSDLDQARMNLKTAVRLFLEEAEKLGTLEEILDEAGYQRSDGEGYRPPRLVATEAMTVTLGR